MIENRVETNGNLKEEWRDVVGYEGLYEVSNLGNVKTLGRVVVDSLGRTRTFQGRLMKQTNSCGYKQVSLTDYNGESKRKSVHILVAEAFLCRGENDDCVNHKDGVKHNNKVTNLEWCSYAYNNVHAREHGLTHDNYEVICFNEDGDFVGIYYSISDASNKVFNGKHRNEIWKRCANITNKLLDGYKFMYAKDYDFDGAVCFAKTKQEARIPSRNYPSAGFDVYACFDEDYVVILPNEIKMIPTGIASAFAEDWVAILKERGSTGTKGMAVRCGVVDSDYRGEWFVPISNVNNVPIVIVKDSVKLPLMLKDAIIYPYTKAIAQFIMLHTPKMNTYEVDFETLKTFESERGTGCLGSSGK